LVTRYEARSCDSIGTYLKINRRGREPSRRDPTPLVSDSLSLWGQGTDSQTSTDGEGTLRQPPPRTETRVVGPGVQTGGSWQFWKHKGKRCVATWRQGLGAQLRGSQPRTLQFIAAQTETEIVWPGELTEEQNAILLL